MKTFVIILIFVGLFTLAGYFSITKKTNRVINFIQIKEMVYHEGWKICGIITIHQDGKYERIVKYYWSPSKEDSVYFGNLPQDLIDELWASSTSGELGWENESRVPTYIRCIDNHRSQHPLSIQKFYTSIEEELIKELEELRASGGFE